MEEDDAVELLGKEVEQIDDHAYQGGLVDENVGTDPVNAEDDTAVVSVGERDTMNNRTVHKGPASAAGGEDAVVGRTTKKSCKCKAVQWSDGPETAVDDFLESEKRSCVTDKCTESLASSISSSSSKFNIPPASDLSQTTLSPIQSIGYHPASVDQIVVESSNLKKTVEKDGDGQRMDKEIQQPENGTTTMVTRVDGITAPTPVAAEQSEVTNDAARQQAAEDGIMDDRPADADRGPDDANVSKNHGYVNVGSATPDHPGDHDCSSRVQGEQGQGRVRSGRLGCGRARGGGRRWERGHGRISTNLVGQHVADGTSRDGGVNQITSNEYSSFLRQLSAIPVTGADADSTLQHIPAAGYIVSGVDNSWQDVMQLRPIRGNVNTEPLMASAIHHLANSVEHLATSIGSAITDLAMLIHERSSSNITTWRAEVSASASAANQWYMQQGDCISVSSRNSHCVGEAIGEALTFLNL